MHLGSLVARLQDTTAKSMRRPMVCIREWVVLSIVAVQNRIEDDIRLGALEPHLLRPKTHHLQRLAPAIGEMRCGSAWLDWRGLR